MFESASNGRTVTCSTVFTITVYLLSNLITNSKAAPPSINVPFNGIIQQFYSLVCIATKRGLERSGPTPFHIPGLEKSFYSLIPCSTPSLIPSTTVPVVFLFSLYFHSNSPLSQIPVTLLVAQNSDLSPGAMNILTCSDVASERGDEEGMYVDVTIHVMGLKVSIQS